MPRTAFRFQLPLVAALLLSSGPLAARTPASVTHLPQPARDGQVWLDHFREDLLPFWNLADAWGQPRGNFPTFRGQDGRLQDPARSDQGFGNAPRWIRENFGIEYTRMKSRQTYFYGVAYHLTGDPKMLELARDGVAWIRANALDKATGSAVSYWEKGVPGPALLERPSQDLAYAGLGLAMYYYLTRDEAVLQDLLRLKEHIFTRYWNQDWDSLMWTVTGPDAGRRELVAQLDQINAYMLLLAPILPEPQKAEWQKTLVKLSRVMIEQYFSPELHLFRGTIQDPAFKYGARHNDFGHTAKALWMIERIGRLTGTADLTEFATREARLVLERAYLPGNGSWASKPTADGVDPGKEWWIFAELDQTAATLALNDPRTATYLPKTYAYWLRVLVDHQQHEVWGGANGETDEPYRGLKIHQWKSGYHSAEHALVSYLTTQSLNRRAATLWFAPADAKAVVRPYFFSGRMERTAASALPGFPGHRRLKVTFTELR
jgi:mannose/cellobiose epimerase-like protein (N-acyl-D-glucosamine 2-epimerase family)